MDLGRDIVQGVTTNAVPEPQFPTCGNCRSLPEEHVANIDQIYSIPTLSTAAAVTGYAERAPNADGTHAVDLPGLRATYDLGGDAEVPCSFPDHQPHLRGYLVRTRCGLTVNIGNICAKRWITNFWRIVTYQKQQREASAGRASLEGLSGLLFEIDALSALAPELKEIRDTIRQDLPALHQEMANRALRSNAEVIITAERRGLDDVMVLDQTRINIRGLSIWKVQHEDIDICQQDIISLKRQVDTLGKDIGIKDAMRLSKEYSVLRDRVNELSTTIEDARQFFGSDENLLASLYAARMSDAVKVEDKTIVYEKSGRQYRLRSDGTRLPVG